MVWNSRDNQCAFFQPIASWKVIRGHWRQQTILFSITLDLREIERWGWLHGVCLIKTRQLICNITYFGHYVTLTRGQIFILTFRGQIMYFLSVATREIRWCHYRCFIFIPHRRQRLQLLHVQREKIIRCRVNDLFSRY